MKLCSWFATPLLVCVLAVPSLSAYAAEGTAPLRLAEATLKLDGKPLSMSHCRVQVHESLGLPLHTYTPTNGKGTAVFYAHPGALIACESSAHPPLAAVVQESHFNSKRPANLNVISMKPVPLNFWHTISHGVTHAANTVAHGTTQAANTVAHGATQAANAVAHVAPVVGTQIAIGATTTVASLSDTICGAVHGFDKKKCQAENNFNRGVYGGTTCVPNEDRVKALLCSNYTVAGIAGMVPGVDVPGLGAISKTGCSATPGCCLQKAGPGFICMAGHMR